MANEYNREEETHFYLLDDGYCSWSTGPDQALTSALYQLLSHGGRATQAIVYTERDSIIVNEGEPPHKYKRILATISINPQVPFDPRPFNKLYVAPE
jgi:hypothetical protein